MCCEKLNVVVSNDGYIAREEMMALLQNCLNLSGQEEEGEDGIKVLNSNVAIRTFCESIDSVWFLRLSLDLV